MAHFLILKPDVLIKAKAPNYRQAARASRAHILLREDTVSDGLLP